MMKRVFLSIMFVAGGVMLKASSSANFIHVYSDSVINSFEFTPLGINVNYLMDGGRFPLAKHSVTDALKGMNVRFLRYPGGEKSDLYQFAPYPYTDARPSVTRTVGLDEYPNMFHSDGSYVYPPLGFDAFMKICRAVNAEPVIVVAADRYMLDNEPGRRISSRAELIALAAAWVHYANRVKGYRVKYWMIGNESWNSNNKYSSAKVYAQDVIEFSKAMKGVDPSVLVIANGEKDDFFKEVILTAGDYIDGLCCSNYGVYDFKRGYSSYRDSKKNLVEPTITAVNALNKYATQEQRNRWKMIVAEFGTIDWFNNWKGINDMGHAIVMFDMIGQLLSLPDVDFACFWNTRWLSNDGKVRPDHDAIDDEGELNPTGFVLKMWNENLDQRLVGCMSSDSSLVVYCSLDSVNGKGHLFVINKGGKPVKSSLSLSSLGSKPERERGWEYYAPSPDSTQPIWERKRSWNVYKPYSISIIEFRYKQ